MCVRRTGSGQSCVRQVTKRTGRLCNKRSNANADLCNPETHRLWRESQ